MLRSNENREAKAHGLSTVFHARTATKESETIPSSRGMKSTSQLSHGPRHFIHMSQPNPSKSGCHTRHVDSSESKTVHPIAQSAPQQPCQKMAQSTRHVATATYVYECKLQPSTRSLLSTVKKAFQLQHRSSKKSIPASKNRYTQ